MLDVQCARICPSASRPAATAVAVCVVPACRCLLPSVTVSSPYTFSSSVAFLLEAQCTVACQFSSLASSNDAWTTCDCKQYFFFNDIRCSRCIGGRSQRERLEVGWTCSTSPDVGISRASLMSRRLKGTDTTFYRHILSTLVVLLKARNCLSSNTRWAMLERFRYHKIKTNLSPWNRNQKARDGEKNHYFPLVMCCHRSRRYPSFEASKFLYAIMCRKKLAPTLLSTLMTAR